MKKLLIVFCLVTVLTLLFACNGVPALAETDDTNNNTATPAAIEQTAEESVVNNVLTPAAIEQTTENGANTKTSKPEKAKKKEAKKSKKVKKVKRVVDYKKYMKNGVFDHDAFAKSLGGKNAFSEDFITNVDFMFDEFFITIGTDKGSSIKDDTYYIGIGFVAYFDSYVPGIKSYDHHLTYFADVKGWGKPITVYKRDNTRIPLNGLAYLQDLAKYMKKHKDPFKKPKMKGLEWKDVSEMDD